MSLLFNQVQTNLASKANLVIFNAFHAGKKERPLIEYIFYREGNSYIGFLGLKFRFSSIGTTNLMIYWMMTYNLFIEGNHCKKSTKLNLCTI